MFQIWERLHSGRRWSDRRSNNCPSGRHPNGTCSCESVLMADEGAHASISRIVMLAEALFEVFFSNTSYASLDLCNKLNLRFFNLIYMLFYTSLQSVVS